MLTTTYVYACLQVFMRSIKYINFYLGEIIDDVFLLGDFWKELARVTRQSRSHVRLVADPAACPEESSEGTEH